MTNDAITDLNALSLSHAIHARQVSCREVMQAYLARIHRMNYPAASCEVSEQKPIPTIWVAADEVAYMFHHYSVFSHNYSGSFHPHVYQPC
jgi:Asp-tRNA(Asn)/Glu-tRNA(Gln) amidotransferase A subunit family amidase